MKRKTVKKISKPRVRNFSLAKADHCCFLVNIPKAQHEQDALGDELIVWVSKDDIYTIESFYIHKHIAPDHFYKLKGRNEYFSHCIDFAKAIISNRLQNDWRSRKIDREYALRILPLYNDEIRAYNLEKSTAQAAGSSKSTAVFNVVQDGIPSTDIVPYKKEK